MKENSGKNNYTCNEYREEMILAALQRRLQQEDLSEEERAELLREIAEFEERMGM